MCAFQLFLGLLLASSPVATSFVAQSGLVSSRGNGEAVQSLPNAPLVPTKPDEASTSLHVGVSYGPPGMVEDQRRSPLLLRNINNINKRFATSPRPFFDVDPAFTALSIAYDGKVEQQEVVRRNMKRSLAASTAILCAMFMARQVSAIGGIPYLVSQLPYFFKVFPLQASIATCGLNSALAGSIAQMQSWKPMEGVFNFEWRQWLSGLVYGSFWLGIGSNLIYTKLLPTLFPNCGLTTIVASAVMDNFVFAPLLWLPPAYAIKAAFARQPIVEAMKKYRDGVLKEKLLLRYWMVWLPAQMITFSVVPKHLRVVSTNIVSFVWFLILTNLTAKNNNKKSA